MLLSLLPLGAFAATEVTLSAGGSLNAALASVDNGGTIRVSGTVSVSETLTAHNKTVTITGGELSFSASTVTLADNITFDNMTLTFPSGATVYAGGYKVTIGPGVTLTNAISIFGGKSGGTVASTDLTLLAGTYNSVYGGSSGGTVTGDTHLTVGGTVNSTIDETNHSGTNRVHGGSTNGGTIGGTAYTVFTGNAKAHYLYGGGYNGGTITGGTDITVSGGKMMHVSGGYRGGTYNGDVKLTITGGTMEQVFGANNGGTMTGNVQLDIMGGTITRRVYGGCYNEATRSGLSVTWSSSNYVTGNIVLTLHSGANITFSSSDNDRSIYAHSRQKTLSSTEVTQLVYADATAYNTYKNKVKAQDTAMKLIMGSTSAADSIHYRSYTASGAAISQSCICGSCSATATLSADNATYTGAALETGKVTYSGTWYGGEPAFAYSNNKNVGTATVSMTAKGVTVSTTFTIEEPAIAPGDVTGDDRIDNDDVIWLLWYTLFGEQEYPLLISGDVNGDNKTDNDDVIYLLWHTLFGAGEYPLH